MTTTTMAMAPQPSPRFWDRIAEKYAKSPIADEAAYQRKLDVTQSYLRPDMEVLEFGCGTGSTALIHAPHVAHLTAFDISSNMIAIAQSKADEQGVDNLTFRQDTIEAFEAAPGSYDAVLGMSILHLLGDRSGAMARVKDLLKPGGVFITSTVCLNDGQWYFWPVLKIGRALGLLPYVSFFRGDRLLSEFTSQGFEIEHHWRPGPTKALFVVARKPV